MDLVFVTLFDSNYIDKGLVLFDSMKRTMDDFKLYVVAFDDRCYEILKAEAEEKMIVISLSEFETPELLEVKQQRTRAEYCWTCSSNAIRYVLVHFGENLCTYIDADMMFFSSPQKVFDEMWRKGCSTIIVPHRFKSEAERIKAHNTVGEYCVEFNTFVNDERGRQALNWWADKCIEWCFYAVPGTTEWYGDQKYLNYLPEHFDGVMVCEDVGVGLAPWNSELVDLDDATIYGEDKLNAPKSDRALERIKDRQTGNTYDLVLYHFESVSFLSKKIMFTPQKFRSAELYRRIYYPYLNAILAKRRYVSDKYGVEFSYKRRVVTKNLIMRFYQRFLSPLRRIRKKTDIYRIAGR